MGRLDENDDFVLIKQVENLYAHMAAIPVVDKKEFSVIACEVSFTVNKVVCPVGKLTASTPAVLGRIVTIAFRGSIEERV